mmetsp:Transcript_46242/g.56030  ORF Transcript_46242/g.56030 Transcript_46242/m.56030 type:complete len:310 (+) Transcript_46242:626-1555(+)
MKVAYLLRVAKVFSAVRLSKDVRVRLKKSEKEVKEMRRGKDRRLKSLDKNNDSVLSWKRERNDAVEKLASLRKEHLASLRQVKATAKPEIAAARLDHQRECKKTERECKKKNNELRLKINEFELKIGNLKSENAYLKNENANHPRKVNKLDDILTTSYKNDVNMSAFRKKAKTKKKEKQKRRNYSQSVIQDTVRKQKKGEGKKHRKSKDYGKRGVKILKRFARIGCHDSLSSISSSSSSSDNDSLEMGRSKMYDRGQKYSKRYSLRDSLESTRIQIIETNENFAHPGSQQSCHSTTISITSKIDIDALD